MNDRELLTDVADDIRHRARRASGWGESNRTGHVRPFFSSTDLHAGPMMRVEDAEHISVWTPDVAQSVAGLIDIVLLLDEPESALWKQAVRMSTQYAEAVRYNLRDEMDNASRFGEKRITDRREQVAARRREAEETIRAAQAVLDAVYDGLVPLEMQ